MSIRSIVTLIVAACLSALTLAMDAAPAAAASSWAVQTPPDPYDTGGVLTAIACTSSTDCWANVSTYYPQDDPVFEHWDGSAWTLVPSAAAANDITCVSVTDCWAVGTQIQHWDGASWALVGGPATALLGVSCVGTDDCWAVGSSFEPDGRQYPATVHWNGAQWQLTRPPTRNNNVFLQALACSSATQCWSVGYRGRSEARSTEIFARWDGRRWDYQPSTAPIARLFGVSCRTGADCWAVGYGQVDGARGPRTVHWDGTTWTPATVPATGRTSLVLTGVSCLGHRNCWAVGTPTNVFSFDMIPTILHWDGTSWTLARTPPVDYPAALADIACVPATASQPATCRAAGGLDQPRTGGGTYHPFVESRAG